MNLILNYSFFLLKIITLFIFIIITPICLNVIKKKIKYQKKFKITVLEEHYKNIKNDILLSKINQYETKKWIQKKRGMKNFFKIRKNKLNDKCFNNEKKTLFILDFRGDINATKVIGLREEISAIILSAKKNDKVLLRLESSGGVMHGYGLAAAQLQRLRQNGIYLIISIDRIAASGGYMMACVANRIISAPFAIIGSIGVIAQLPNFNKLLKKHNIDIELHTAGDYKRTLTMFGNNTKLMRNKFRKELCAAHDYFKKFVQEMRPILNIDQVSNGEHWFGNIALKKKLVDEIDISDNILISKMHQYTLLNIKYIYKKKKLANISCFIFDQIKNIMKKIYL